VKSDAPAVFRAREGIEGSVESEGCWEATDALTPGHTSHASEVGRQVAPAFISERDSHGIAGYPTASDPTPGAGTRM